MSTAVSPVTSLNGETVHDEVILAVSHKEWMAHRDKVNMFITLLSATLGGLAASPFGGFLPAELLAELERLNATP